MRLSEPCKDLGALIVTGCTGLVVARARAHGAVPVEWIGVSRLVACEGHSERVPEELLPVFKPFCCREEPCLGAGGWCCCWLVVITAEPLLLECCRCQLGVGSLLEAHMRFLRICCW